MTDQRLTEVAERELREFCEGSTYIPIEAARLLLAEIDRLRAIKTEDDDALSRASGLLADECTRVLELRGEIDRLQGERQRVHRLSTMVNVSSRFADYCVALDQIATLTGDAAPDATVPPPRPQGDGWDEQRGHWLEAWEKAHPDKVEEAAERLRDHATRQTGSTTSEFVKETS